MHIKYSHDRSGFTLIELSIVLVIIGLIVGGVLTGRDLIHAAEVRATISQIEKYNTVTNTFLGKYGALPGDIPAVLANRFGFAARGTNGGEGDGNGAIEGTATSGNNNGADEAAGETIMFWADLSKAGLIDGSFTVATSATPANFGTGTPGVKDYFPEAKLGGGNYIYVWNGGMGIYCGGGPGCGNDRQNYFGISVATRVNGTYLYSNPGLTPSQAYAIDKKMDDGLPLTGTVQSNYLDGTQVWAGGTFGGYGESASSYAGTAVSPATYNCSDNGGSAANPMLYSLTQDKGNDVACAVSFKFQ